MTKKLTTEQFIEKAIIKHGTKYDYSKVIYISSHSTVEIGCPSHGWFTQKGYQHLNYGCKKCGDDQGSSQRRTGLERFITKSKIKHGNRYDYSHVVFNSQHDLVEIICPIHGQFRQAANDHLKGRGCNQCGIEARVTKRTGKVMPTEVFVSKAKETHGDAYFYTRTEYRGPLEKVTITCKLHGDFKQLPNNHLMGNGCQQCGQDSKVISFEEFFERAQAIHGSRYLYDSNVYTKMSEKVGITCAKHGFFWQNAVDHIHAESGCPSCAIEDKTKSQNEWLDVMEISEREVWLNVGTRKFKVDGYDSETRTIYEFWGDFWHGNPNVFDLSNMNWVVGVTFGELYEKTLNKRRAITENGYKLVEIWENDWKRIYGKKTRKR